MYVLLYALIYTGVPVMCGANNTRLGLQEFPTIIPALSDNTTDNDYNAMLALLQHVIQNSNHSAINADNTGTTTEAFNSLRQDLINLFMNTRKPTLPSAFTHTISTDDPATRTTGHPINTSDIENLKDLTDVKNAFHTYNETVLQLDNLNIIMSRVYTIINTQSVDVREVMHVLTHLSSASRTNTETVQTCTSILTKVIQDETNSTDQVTDGSFESAMPELLLSMESVLSATLPSDVISISTPEIEVSSEIIQSNGSVGDSVVLQTIVGTVTMPFILFAEGQIRATTIVYQNIQKRLTVHKYRHAQIGSHVMSVSLQRLHNTTVEKLEVEHPKSITMILPTTVNGREKKRLCTYWNFDKGIWDTSGGRLLTKNDTHTECQFDHLTNFAVLVVYYRNTALSKLQKQTLFILTTVGCSLSIACLGVALILYLYLRLLSNEKILIHANLNAALLLAQLVLVTSHGAESFAAACKTVAVLLHYLFMASFSWMMVEGLALYLACTRGLYNYGDMRLKYFLIGWGLPAIIVVVSVGTQFPNYGETTDDSCWLSVKDGLIWAFMGPMLVIVVFNLFILCLVIKVFLTLRANSRKSEAAKLRASVKAMVTLLPLLGSTWALSILVPLHYVFHYLFVIGNSMQGIMIFLLHGIGNEEVRKRLSERRKRYSVSGSETDISENHNIRDVKFDELRVPRKTIMNERRSAWM